MTLDHITDYIEERKLTSEEKPKIRILKYEQNTICKAC